MDMFSLRQKKAKLVEEYISLKAQHFGVALFLFRVVRFFVL